MGKFVGKVGFVRQEKALSSVGVSTNPVLRGATTPCLEEHMRNNQSVRIIKVAFQRSRQIIKLSVANHLLPQKTLTKILDKIQEYCATPVTRRIDMNQRIHPNLDESSFLKHAWHFSPDEQVNAIHI